MKKFLKYIKQRTVQNMERQTKSSSFAAQESARIFTTYEKTFKDLARYDRGEKIFSN